MFDSKAEEKFMNYFGWTPNTLELDIKSHIGEQIKCRPDTILFDYEDNIYFVEFKGGNLLTNIGARGGKAAAEKDKHSYIENSFGSGTTEQRMAYASATKGWNHSIHSKVSLQSHFSKIDKDRSYSTLIVYPSDSNPEQSKQVMNQVDKTCGLKIITTNELDNLVCDLCLLPLPEKIN